MKHFYPNKRIFTVLVLSLTLHSCLNNDYDLGNVSLKMTLGPNGITLPLGQIDSLTVDSLIRSANNDGAIVPEDGFYAYKLKDTIHTSIDAIAIDPIRDVIPEIDPYKFKFSEGALPESFAVKGLQNTAKINIPSFDFTDQTLNGVQINKEISISRLIGQTVPTDQPIELPQLDEENSFGFYLDDIPAEVKSIDKLFFSGATLGTPIQVKFSLGAVAAAVKSGTMALTLTLPDAYTLKLGNNYGNHASISGGTLTLSGYPVTESEVNLEFYLAERTVTETIQNRRLDIDDQIHYTFQYTGISNGQSISGSNAPEFALTINPKVGDAQLVTNDITPDPETSTTDMEFKIDNLSGISEVQYVAFTTNTSNAIVLSATNPNLPLQGNITVRIAFPYFLDFAAGIPNMSGNVLTTTLEALHTSSIRLPLDGVSLTGDDRKVVGGVLSVSKPITVVVTPVFPSDSYKLSELKTTTQPNINLVVSNMTFYLDPGRSVIAAGLSEQIDIAQQIDETFEVPDEVGAIHYAEVVNNNTFGSVSLDIVLNISNTPVDKLYINNINIALPAFLDAEHPKLDTKTNILHIDRIVYEKRPVTIAQITINGIRNLPVKATATGKTAILTGEVQLKATLTVPDGSVIEGIDQTEITVTPQVTLPPLKIKYVKGVMDIDMGKYLEPTTIDLKDLRESLGDQNVELNLVAPQIALKVENPMAATMVGSIVLQPYDFNDKKLDAITVRNITIKPAVYATPTTTNLLITDASAAPEGYTLCRVEDLSKLVKVIPSKIDVSFDLGLDKDKEQGIAITGKEYAFDVDYEIKLPLKFKENADINYSGTTDVSDSFNEIENYNVTVEDVLISLHAKNTLPLDLGVTLEFLDAKEKVMNTVKGTIIGDIKGYNPATDGDYKESDIQVRLELEDGDIQQLKNISEVKYTIKGKAVGTEAGLSPDQYVSLNMKLALKKGITLDLESFNVEY